MPFWPVAAREARAAARAPRTYAWRAAVTTIGIAAIPISLWLARAAPSPGRAVFLGISGMALIYCLFGGIIRTADAIAEEKRENTLGLLFLTDLKAGDVLSGKLLASTATLFFGVLAMLPLLAIPALLGGVTSNDLIRMSLCLVNSLFFSISLGFLVSTFFRQGWITLAVALGAMLMIVFLAPLLTNVAPPWLDHALLSLSPATMFALIASNTAEQSFWQAFAVTHFIAWLNILYTAHYLPRFWQERPRSKRAQLWWERMRRLRFGGAKTRTKFRTRLLNRNPLFWLSGREQVSSGGLMVFLMVIVALSLVSEWQQVLYGLIALHATLLVRMASAASHALAEDRKSGALELLLATRLSVREVLKGRWMALGRQFFGPILIVVIWHLFTILWLSVMSPWHDISLPLFVIGFGLALSWIATGWYGMWMGLRARHPIAAIWSTLTTVVLLPWIVLGGLFSLLASFQLLPEFRFGGNGSFIVIGCYGWGAYLFLLIGWTKRRIRQSFREAATDRFTDTQPIDWRPFWRLTWRVTGAIGLIILAVWGVRFAINYRGEKALQNILAAHPEFTLQAPPSPFVPRAQNLAQWGFVDLLNHSLPINPPKARRQSNKIEDIIIVPQHSIAQGLGGWARGRRYLASSPSVLRDIEKDLISLHLAARDRPFIHFTPQTAGMFLGQFNNFYYGALQNIPALLSLRAQARLQAGERPLDDILLAMRFANSLTNDPLALGSRHLMLFQTIQPIYDGILDGRWSDSDLQAIQKVFSESPVWDHHDVWRHYVVREVANASMQPIPANPWAAPPLILGNRPFHFGGHKQTSRLPGRLKAQQAEIIRFGLETLRPLGDSKKRQVQRWMHERQRDDDFRSYLKAVMRFSLDNETRSLATTQTAVDQVITACAIERFRLAEGKLPLNLQQLRPKYLTNIPNDVITGEALKYRLTEDGYLLYSVAFDSTDHKGALEKIEWIKGKDTSTPGDWVWIYKK